MHIAISGSSGMVGQALSAALRSDGHDVDPLVRDDRPGIRWSPDTGEVVGAKMGEVDALVHLAGEGIADGRWTKAKKARIRESREVATRLLCETLAAQERRPQTLICASAIGYYGDRGDEVLDEESSPGKGFLAEVCQGWESATQPAAAAGMRVVNVRIGVVLSRQGGALKKMLLPFQLGMGGRLGSGRQYMSWITLTDLVRVIQYAMETPSLAGPVNGVSPGAATNLEFTKALGKALRRPTVIPMPAMAARLALGELADELLLASARVIPKKLQQSGFSFEHAQLDEALRHVLSKPI